MTNYTRPQKVKLRLSNGVTLSGELIGAPLISSGELVFTTAMVGYTEALTDPSYFGQILVFTYPLIGNYGIPDLPKDLANLILTKGFESSKIHASATIISSSTEQAFHWNSHRSLHQWLLQQRTPGITGIDTRALTQMVRDSDKLLGQVLPENPENPPRDPYELTSQCFYDPGLHKVIDIVSTKQKMTFGKGKIKIGLIDCGVKWNIIRQLVEHDCEVEVLPWNTDFSKINCQGWVISNGPGDPANTGDLKDRVAKLLKENRPILGICLGNQILALAAGAHTKRMKYGHRSHNQPVFEVGSHKGCITSQNHGYEVEKSTLPNDWSIWFLNANDQSVEGIKHNSKPFRAVQFHPEASGGPQDSNWIIGDFIREVKEGKEGKDK